MSMLVLALALLLQDGGAAAETRTATVAATDEKGAAVTGLSVTDIAVLEGGVARPVVRFEHDSRPLTLAVLVDSSAPLASQYRLQLVEPVLAFLRALPEGTRYALWTTGDRPRKIVDYTTDVAQAARALTRVSPAGGNRVIDALVEAARELKGREAERTAVVAVTGLGPGFSDYDRRGAVDAALESGAAFYTVTFDDAEVRGDERNGDVSGLDYDYVLSSLPERSGGTRATLLSAMGTAGALQKTAADLAGRYRLTYQSAGGKSRKIEVTSARPGVKLRVGSAH